MHYIILLICFFKDNILMSFLLVSMHVCGGGIWEDLHLISQSLIKLLFNVINTLLRYIHSKHSYLIF
jgi:hypothetical protein